MKYLCKIDSPFGELQVASDKVALTELWIDQNHYREDDFVKYSGGEGRLAFCIARRWLQDYFDGLESEEWPVLHPQSTPFQKRVWDMLKKIPYGDTMSYQRIADKMNECTGEQSTSKEVEMAVRQNPLNILIPSHRAIMDNGAIAPSMGWGTIQRKLLELEGVRINRDGKVES